MLELPLTKGLYTLIDDEDGWVEEWLWNASKSPTSDDHYAIRSHRLDGGGNTTISLHRQLLDAPPGVLIDHINGDTLDNRRENLRFHDYGREATLYDIDTLEIPLLHDRFALVDIEDEWITKYKWVARGRTLYMHRLLLHAPAGVQVDHRDGDGLNSRQRNIRLATATQNAWNHGLFSSNTSGVTGVSCDMTHQKWIATIDVNGRTIFLGGFKYEDFDAARKARRDAEIKYFGDFRRKTTRV